MGAGAETTLLYNECRRVVVAMVLFCLAAPAAAQTVVDGSDKNVPPELLRAAVEAAADTLFDPYGAQFRRLQVDENLPANLCGLVNAKNLNGAFTGFGEFYFNAESYFSVKKGTFTLMADEPDDVSRQLVSYWFTGTLCGWTEKVIIPLDGVRADRLPPESSGK